MGIHFENVPSGSAPDTPLTFSIAPGTICAVVGLDDSPAREVLELAAGRATPGGGVVRAPTVAAPGATWESTDPVAIRAAIEGALGRSPEALVVGPAFWLVDAAIREVALVGMHELARAGMTVLFAGIDLEAVRAHADEAVVFSERGLELHAEPNEALARFAQLRAEAMQRLLSVGEPQSGARHGDGRAELTELVILDAQGNTVAAASSGDAVTVRVAFRYSAGVENPVIGLLLRNRIGISTYGTNTELEGLSLGPVAASETRTVAFSFGCDLCPGLYTLTAASHDPDGTAHDWWDEAILLTVTGDRYVEGVANLRAKAVRIGD